MSVESINRTHGNGEHLHTAATAPSKPSGRFGLGDREGRGAVLDSPWGLWWCARWEAAQKDVVGVLAGRARWIAGFICCRCLAQ